MLVSTDMFLFRMKSYVSLIAYPSTCQNSEYNPLHILTTEVFLEFKKQYL